MDNTNNLVVDFNSTSVIPKTTTRNSSPTSSISGSSNNFSMLDSNSTASTISPPPSYKSLSGMPTIPIITSLDSLLIFDFDTAIINLESLKNAIIELELSKLETQANNDVETELNNRFNLSTENGRKNFIDALVENQNSLKEKPEGLNLIKDKEKLRQLLKLSLDNKMCIHIVSLHSEIIYPFLERILALSPQEARSINASSRMPNTTQTFSFVKNTTSVISRYQEAKHYLPQEIILINGDKNNTTEIAEMQSNPAQFLLGNTSVEDNTNLEEKIYREKINSIGFK